MVGTIEKSRNGCALQGAIKTIEEIKGVVPIVHSTAGCSIQQEIVKKVSYSEGFSIPSSNIIEKQVIFGGGSRLREQIKNTVKVIEGDLYVTLSGCSSELVGDDVVSMTKEAQDQGEPVIYYKAPGFKGKVQLGYEGVVNSIINQLEIVSEVNSIKDDKVVNIIGIIPEQDIFWRGDIEEIKRIFEGIGLKVNALFGFEEDINSWKDIPSAALNISFSKWGTSIVENLKSKYGTEYISLRELPVGAKKTSKLLYKIGEKLGVESPKIRSFVKREEEKERYYLNNLVNLYFDNNFQRTFALVGEESLINGIGDFLFETIGFIPKVKIITDPIYEDEELTKGIHYSEDANEIEEILRKSYIELVLGSSLESEISKELNVPLHVISYPAEESILLNKGYVGYSGAINLLEDLSTLIIKYEKQIDKEIIESINLRKIGGE
jgi:nitrogenase molybdenum-iron protein beta chain